MWPSVGRALVVNFGAGQVLTDDQFRLLEPLIPRAKPGGRPRTTDTRTLLDGLFYLVRTGCQWRHLPSPPAFPPWRTVYGYMRAFLRDGVWESIRHHFVVMLREGAGREASPTAAVVDTHSVRTTERGGPRGWDAAKRLKGRRRHVPLDTNGLPLGILVHPADIQDADSLGDLLRRVKPLYSWLQAVFADSIYNRLAALLACFVASLPAPSRHVARSSRPPQGRSASSPPRAPTESAAMTGADRPATSIPRRTRAGGSATTAPGTAPRPRPPRSRRRRRAAAPKGRASRDGPARSLRQPVPPPCRPRRRWRRRPGGRPPRPRAS
jgi:putative transposase